MANAASKEAVYNYQQKLLNAYSEVVTNMNAVDNNKQAHTLKLQEVQELYAAVSFGPGIIPYRLCKLPGGDHCAKERAGSRAGIKRAEKEYLYFINSTPSFIGRWLAVTCCCHPVSRVYPFFYFLRFGPCGLYIPIFIY